VPAYVEALLERTADGLDELTRTMRRTEEGRETAAASQSAHHRGRGLTGRPEGHRHPG